MTAADGMFFAADGPTSPQIIGGLVLLSASGGRSPAEAVEAVSDALLASARQLPVLRERMRYRFPRSLRRPHWPVGDLPDAGAVQRAVLPDEATVRRQVATLLRTPLDVQHRPWALDVLGSPGVEVAGQEPDGPARVTVLFRLHHSFTDGLGVISLTRGLFDEGGAHRQPPGADPAATDSAPAANQAGQAVAAAGTVRERLKPRVSAAQRGSRSLASTARGVLGLASRGSAPVVPWHGRISAERSLTVVELPLEATQAQAKALGVGMTALVAAAATEGLLRLPEVATAVATGGLRELRAMLPVAVRSAGTWHDLGNHTAGVPLDIPMTAGSLAERARAIQNQLSQAGQEQQARAARVVVAQVPKLIPPPLHRLLVRAVYGPKWFSMIVTAMPGPRQQQHMGGQPVRGVGGILPLPPGVALTIGALRWTQTLTVTVLADPAAFPDLSPVREQLAALDEIPAAADDEATVERPA
jgi:WS/DGAT/MGAT family acyltransferase